MNSKSRLESLRAEALRDLRRLCCEDPSWAAKRMCQLDKALVDEGEKLAASQAEAKRLRAEKADLRKRVIRQRGNLHCQQQALEEHQGACRLMAESSAKLYADVARLREAASAACAELGWLTQQAKSRDGSSPMNALDALRKALAQEAGE